MALDPAAAQLLDFLAQAGGGGLEGLPPDEARRQYEVLGASSAPPLADVASVETAAIAGVACRIVVPEGAGPFPVLVWFHGGGWVIGSAELSLPVARALAAAAHTIVVTVEYRLAPEHPYPAALDDCLAVTRAVLTDAATFGGDPTRVAVGGDSSGGNLAAVVAAEVPGLVYQLLVYPVTDATQSCPSVDENGEGYLLTKATMAWFIAHYLSAGVVGDDDPRVSPLFAPDEVLAEVPPALVITAEFDPLRDEGEAYVDRLQSVGVAARARRYDGQVHGFFSMGGVMPAGVDAVREAAEALRGALAAGPAR